MAYQQPFYIAMNNANVTGVCGSYDGGFYSDYPTCSSAAGFILNALISAFGNMSLIYGVGMSGGGAAGSVDCLISDDHGGNQMGMHLDLFVQTSNVTLAVLLGNATASAARELQSSCYQDDNHFDLLMLFGVGLLLGAGAGLLLCLYVCFKKPSSKSEVQVSLNQPLLQENSNVEHQAVQGVIVHHQNDDVDDFENSAFR